MDHVASIWERPQIFPPKTADPASRELPNRHDTKATANIETLHQRNHVNRRVTGVLLWNWECNSIYRTSTVLFRALDK